MLGRKAIKTGLLVGAMWEGSAISLRKKKTRQCGEGEHDSESGPGCSHTKEGASHTEKEHHKQKNSDKNLDEKSGGFFWNSMVVVFIFASAYFALIMMHIQGMVSSTTQLLGLDQKKHEILRNQTIVNYVRYGLCCIFFFPVPIVCPSVNRFSRLLNGCKKVDDLPRPYCCQTDDCASGLCWLNCCFGGCCIKCARVLDEKFHGFSQ